MSEKGIKEPRIPISTHTINKKKKKTKKKKKLKPLHLENIVRGKGHTEEQIISYNGGKEKKPTDEQICSRNKRKRWKLHPPSALELKFFFYSKQNNTSTVSEEPDAHDCETTITSAKCCLLLKLRCLIQLSRQRHFINYK